MGSGSLHRWHYATRCQPAWRGSPVSRVEAASYLILGPRYPEARARSVIGVEVSARGASCPGGSYFRRARLYLGCVARGFTASVRAVCCTWRGAVKASRVKVSATSR